jgi:hypothetical protein
MNDKLFQYPRRIENEWEVLDVYRKKFPGIVKEYERIVRKTYCNPVEYRKTVDKKVKVFDRLLSSHAKKFRQIEPTFSNLLKLAVEVHRNYAFNFWVISYAINEGPLAQHYVKLIEDLLSKLYPQKEKFFSVRDAFIRTDYDIFYHKILVDSIEIADLLKKIPDVSGDLVKAKSLSPESREKIYDRIVARLFKVNTQPAQRILKIWERHLKKKNLTPVYNMLNQGLDNYEENLKSKKDLIEVGKIIKKTLKYGEKNLSKDDSKKLKNLYFLIKEMLQAKDFTFGRRDPKLFAFWDPLTVKIVDLAEKELGIKLQEKEKIFLTIPWALEKKLPKNLKSILKGGKNA